MGNVEFMQTFQGTIQELGFSIFMQGSHKLLDSQEELVALLQAGSEDIDLNEYLGVRVEVGGTASPSVEGNSTFVNVVSVKKL